MVAMNISGVTMTAPVLPQNQTVPQPPAPESRPESDPDMNMSAMNTSMMASIQVMDMAQDAFEDAAMQLIETMSAMTGVGQNVDMMV
jgi:hypothetical protein